MIEDLQDQRTKNTPTLENETSKDPIGGNTPPKGGLSVEIDCLEDEKEDEDQP